MIELSLAQLRGQNCRIEENNAGDKRLLRLQIDYKGRTGLKSAESVSI